MSRNAQTKPPQTLVTMLEGSNLILLTEKVANVRLWLQYYLYGSRDHYQRMKNSPLIVRIGSAQ